jgi:hypothetical protein
MQARMLTGCWNAAYRLRTMPLHGRRLRPAGCAAGRSGRNWPPVRSPAPKRSASRPARVGRHREPRTQEDIEREDARPRPTPPWAHRRRPRAMWYSNASPPTRPRPGSRRFHLWTPRSRQGKTSGSLLRVVGCCHLSGLRCGRKTAAGPDTPPRKSRSRIPALSPWQPKNRPDPPPPPSPQAR